MGEFRVGDFFELTWLNISAKHGWHRNMQGKRKSRQMHHSQAQAIQLASLYASAILRHMVVQVRGDMTPISSVGIMGFSWYMSFTCTAKSTMLDYYSAVFWFVS